MPALASTQLSSAQLDYTTLRIRRMCRICRVCNAISAEYRVSLSVSSDAQLTVISPAVKGHKLCERLAEEREEEGSGGGGCKGEHPLVCEQKQLIIL